MCGDERVMAVEKVGCRSSALIHGAGRVMQEGLYIATLRIQHASTQVWEGGGYVVDVDCDAELEIIDGKASYQCRSWCIINIVACSRSAADQCRHRKRGILEWRCANCRHNPEHAGKAQRGGTLNWVAQASQHGWKTSRIVWHTSLEASEN